MGFARDIADVGENKHRQVLIEEMRHRFRRRLALGEPNVSERSERASDVIARRKQRLRGVGGRARNHADRTAAPALIKQLHRAGGMLAGDLDSGDVVADFDRQIELRLGLAIRGFEGKGRFAERQPLEVKRPHRPGCCRTGGGPSHLDAECAGGIVGRSERERLRNAAGHDRDRTRFNQLREIFHELGAVTDIGCVGQPNHLDVARIGKEAPDGWQRLRAIDGVRHRLDLL